MFIQPLVCPNVCNPTTSNQTKTNRHIPLLLEWDSVTLPLEEDPPINPSTSTFLAPRYYIKLFHPSLYNTDQSFSPNPIIYKIDRYGLLTNKLQIALRPSLNRSEEALYKVEYWYWRKKIDIGNKSNITHTFIKGEYWYIPNIIPSLKSIQLKRKDDDKGIANVDTLPRTIAPEIFFINSVTDKEGWEDWSLVYSQMNAPIKELTNERIVLDIGVHWVKGPRPSSTYTLSYYQPLNFKEVLRLPLDYPNYPNANPPINISTFYRY